MPPVLLFNTDDVLLAQNGCERAFERLVKAAHQVVNCIALAITRDVDAANDVTQQVFIKVWQELHQLKNPSSFLPWLRQITRRFALNTLRGADRSRVLKGDEGQAHIARAVDPCEHASASLFRCQQSAIINELLDELEPENRDIVLLFYREEQNCERVAALLDLSPKAVRKRLQRLREKLKVEVLSRYGDAIIATAPIGLVSVILSAITPAAPAAAASISATIAHKTLAGKCLAMVGGATIGVVVGLGAQYFGAKAAIDKEPNNDQRTTLIRLRSLGLLWSTVMLIAVACGYYFTLGWFWPLLAYTLFIAGLIFYIFCFWAVSSLTSQANAFWRWSGLLCGAFTGYAGLLVGLYQAGRFL